MADYYPLLARALDALPDRTPAMRRAVYDRARNALIGQLRSIEPPLSDADIDLERQRLDRAIERLEATYGVPAPANDAVAAEAAPVPAPPPEPAPPAPAVEPEPEPAEPEFPEPKGGGTPLLPPAPPPSFALPPEPEAEPREAAVPIAPRRTKGAPADPAPEEPAAAAAEEPAVEPEAAPREAGGPRQRPRIDVVAPRGRSRLLRNAVVGSVLAVVIGLIAVAAFLLRDKPADLQPFAAGGAGSQAADGADAKFGDRVGGEQAPAERPAPSAPGDGRATSLPDLAVAQRAVLIEENPSNREAAPTSTGGRVVWRLESVSGGQGQPLETAVVATVSIPEAGLDLLLTLQRNLDATLPASHTINLTFVPTGPAGQGRTVQDIGLLQAKEEEAARGSPLSGLPVRVRENLFLIGLSSLRNDVERNTDLLLHRPWFDLALRYANGQRAVLTFEKGGAGTQVMQRAFDQWR